MKALDVSVVIISFNTRDLTLACLRSVFAQTDGITFEIIIVDNASTDGSAAAIAEAFPSVRLVQLSENVGFAKANNLAAREGKGEWILLLNPDTVILDGAIQRVVAFAREHPEAGVFGGRTYFGDGSLNYNSCHGAPTPWSLFCMGTGLSSLFRRSRLFNPESLGSWPRDSVRAVDAVTGCFLLIRGSLWHRLNGFDQSFFMYGEDTDLCLRARQAGNTCLICPDATLIHYGGKSEKVRADKMVRLFRAKAQLFRKHWGKAFVPFGICMLIIWALTRALALTGLRLVRPAIAPSARAWAEVWYRRGEYMQATDERCGFTHSDPPSTACDRLRA